MKMDASHYSYKGFVGNTQKPRHAQIIRADDMFFKEVNETNDMIEKEMVPQVPYDPPHGSAPIRTGFHFSFLRINSHIHNPNLLSPVVLT